MRRRVRRGFEERAAGRGQRPVLLLGDLRAGKQVVAVGLALVGVGWTHTDLAWSYDFPTRQLLPITGMIAFYDKKVDHVLDGQLPGRPKTHFFS